MRTVDGSSYSNCYESSLIKFAPIGEVMLLNRAWTLKPCFVDLDVFAEGHCHVSRSIKTFVVLLKHLHGCMLDFMHPLGGP